MKPITGVIDNTLGVTNRWDLFKQFLSYSTIRKIESEWLNDCTEDNPKYIIRFIGVTCKKEDDIEKGLKKLAKKVESASKQYNIVGSGLPCIQLEIKSVEIPGLPFKAFEKTCFFSCLGFEKPNPFNEELFCKTGMLPEEKESENE